MLKLRWHWLFSVERSHNKRSLKSNFIRSTSKVVTPTLYLHHCRCIYRQREPSTIRTAVRPALVSRGSHLPRCWGEASVTGVDRGRYHQWSPACTARWPRHAVDAARAALKLVGCRVAAGGWVGAAAVCLCVGSCQTSPYPTIYRLSVEPVVNTDQQCKNCRHRNSLKTRDARTILVYRNVISVLSVLWQIICRAK